MERTKTTLTLKRLVRVYLWNMPVWKFKSATWGINQKEKKPASNRKAGVKIKMKQKQKSICCLKIGASKMTFQNCQFGDQSKRKKSTLPV